MWPFKGNLNRKTDRAKSKSTITHPPCITVKMATTPIVLHSGQRDLIPHLKFLGPIISKKEILSVTLETEILIGKATKKKKKKKTFFYGHD